MEGHQTGGGSRQVATLVSLLPFHIDLRQCFCDEENCSEPQLNDHRLRRCQQQCASIIPDKPFPRHCGNHVFTRILVYYVDRVYYSWILCWNLAEWYIVVVVANLERVRFASAVEKPKV